MQRTGGLKRRKREAASRLVTHDNRRKEDLCYLRSDEYHSSIHAQYKNAKDDCIRLFWRRQREKLALERGSGTLSRTPCNL